MGVAIFLELFILAAPNRAGPNERIDHKGKNLENSKSLSLYFLVSVISHKGYNGLVPTRITQKGTLSLFILWNTPSGFPTRAADFLFYGRTARRGGKPALVVEIIYNVVALKGKLFIKLN